ELACKRQPICPAEARLPLQCVVRADGCVQPHRHHVDRQLSGLQRQHSRTIASLLIAARLSIESRAVARWASERQALPIALLWVASVDGGSDMAGSDVIDVPRDAHFR